MSSDHKFAIEMEIFSDKDLPNSLNKNGMNMPKWMPSTPGNDVINCPTSKNKVYE